jgi:long-subunit acyl-CoA synthetase (AMP-forming)
VSIQLPNWAEWLILHCAATKIGAVTNSIGAVYREREVEYILDCAETSVVAIPDTFRGFSYTDMLTQLRPRLPIRGLGALEDLVHEGEPASEIVAKVRPVGHETTGLRILAVRVCRWQAVLVRALA